jgi:phage gp36-like protein
MSYTANGDLLTIMAERILIQLSDDDPLAADPDWLVIAEARAYADGQIDARLRQRYRLPLATVPRELRDWALALARRWLYERRPDGPELPEAVRDAAKEALAALDAVRDGKMSLDVPVDETAPPAAAGLVYVVAPERHFSRATLDLY